MDEPRSWSAIVPLPIRTLLPIRKPMGPDPIRFTMQANKTRVDVGEEFEITITAELLPILSSQLFFFESQRSYSLKLLQPEGFSQTGGDYYHLVSGTLSAEGVSRMSYSLRGTMQQPSKGCFRLLRGDMSATDRDLFVDKGVLCISINNDSLRVHSIPDSLGSVPQARALATSASCSAPTIGWKGGFAQKRNDVCMETASNPVIATLEVRGCSGTINWYRSVNGGSSVLVSSGTSVFYETQSPHQANSVTYSYFARCVCSDGGESPLSNEYTVQLNRCSSCPANWVNDGGAYCNGDHRYQNQRDNNGCSTTFNQVKVVDLGFSCSSQSTPNWQWTENYSCNNDTKMRYRMQHDYNGCTNQGDRWLEVEACSGACGGQSPNWQNKEVRCNGGNRQWWQHDDNGCTNQGDRWGDVVEYNTCACISLSAPSDPTFNGGDISTTCQGTQITFSSSCPTGQVHWKRYDSPGGTMIGQAIQSQLQSGSETPPGQYYYSVECSSNNCSGPIKTFTFIVVAPSPPILSASQFTICSGNSSVLTAANCAGVVTWSTGQVGVNSITVTPTATTQYNAICTLFPGDGSSCQSPVASILIRKQPEPPTVPSGGQHSHQPQHLSQRHR